MENQQLIDDCIAKAQEWTSSNLYDEETRRAVSKMVANPDKTELIESFYKNLEFGTGGLRGIMGAGTNRMNVYTVGTATQGLSNYLKRSFADREKISVVVGHDCRNNSRLFAETCAAVFSANGIHVYLFEDMRPTPEMSYAIRRLGCQSGVVVTASHNPKEYNGYKAYWEDGAQVLSPHDTGIIDEVTRVTVADVRFEANPVLIKTLGKDMDEEYLEKVHTLSIDPDVIRRQSDLKIVYTPLHGTGMMLIPQSLKMWGFNNVHTVAEQMVRDGNFPTVKSPNPENGEALTLALKLAKEIDADIVMASDPDADRVGMACKNDRGEWVLINGNQTCMLFLYYIIKNRIARGLMKGNEFIVKTIVTNETIHDMAVKNGVGYFDCYTGFKWIAREVRLHQDEGDMQYIGGGEESYGFMAEDFCRDKDAVSACSLLAEICAWAKDQGKTLYDVLMDLYAEYGFSYNKTINVVRPGKSGADEIQAMMVGFRKNRPSVLAGSKVLVTKDYQELKVYGADGEVSSLDMADSSNVLQWFTEDGTKISVRPSGTEPKIKFYIEVKGDLASAAEYDQACQQAEVKVAAVVKDLNINE
ncbi:phospho-sugar mutase [Alloprevotella rava]|uniref:Phosphoglucomutase n=2 Tax=Alloprevotella rava TaxID=671218 RepID=G5G9M5_9BACT|nr:phospho-sugar mutase [Alloprevotella rava]EHG24075.1 hypothetical protein HMPREF9332_00276 [Alloprevotella rava F0323]MBB3703669.1 phosphoglucomutase [Alloprevotella rava]